MNQINLKFDARWICLLLLAVIAVMLIIWQPWHAKSDRTITALGSATVQAVPDSFQFFPSYSATASSSSEATAKVTATGNSVVVALKGLGVKDGEITTSVTAGDSQPVPEQGPAQIMPSPPIKLGEAGANYAITVNVKDKNLAQNISNYLSTTSATGAITPQARFSPAMVTKLDADARSKAVDDALKKAQAEASELSVKLGHAISISDYPSGSIKPMWNQGSAAGQPNASGPIVSPGNQDISVQVSVVFAIR